MRKPVYTHRLGDAGSDVYLSEGIAWVASSWYDIRSISSTDTGLVHTMQEGQPKS